MNTHAAVHEILHVERAAVRGHGQSLRGAARGEADDLRLRPGIQHGDLATGFECDKEVGPPGIKGDGAGHAGVVDVHTGRQILRLGDEIEPRNDGAQGVFVIEVPAVAQQTALDVVLL